MSGRYRTLLERQRLFFDTDITKDVDFRQKQLDRLGKWIVSHQESILAVLKKDLGKSSFEGYMAEMMGALQEIREAVRKLPAWAKPQKVRTPLTLFKAKSYYIYEPFGIVAIIGTWNYPFGLVISALTGALAAGNCCVIKPSELAPETSALLAQMVADCFDPGYCAVVEGGVEESTALLDERFDFIHYTGSARVGKIVAQAAAKHLTPVVLELGGKSPCIVDQTADIELAARRICWGKFLNAGQTCIAPDYILVHRNIKTPLLEAIKKELHAFYGDSAARSGDFCRIINTHHFDRLALLLESGKIVTGGQKNREALYIEPTVMEDIAWDSPVMREEIFGPILPVMAYDELSDVLSVLKKQEKPLALYIFSQDKGTINTLMRTLSFGGGCINATVLHYANSYLPFGGVGQSGMGHYHGKWSFDAFSHKKSILEKSLFFDIKLLYPPYKDKLKWLRWL